MPLPPAEKMKRYGEKLKNNPEKYNQIKVLLVTLNRHDKNFPCFVNLLLKFCVTRKVKSVCLRHVCNAQLLML